MPARGRLLRPAAGSTHQAIEATTLDRETLRTIARAHRVCPYYLGQELARWADIVVGDFNHYFDSNAILFGLTAAHEWRVAVLVDEAHNLLERGRAMYSARLAAIDLASAAPFEPSRLEPADGAAARDDGANCNKISSTRDRTHPAVPERFTAALKDVCTAIADHLAEQPAQAEAELLAFHFDALHFLHLVDVFADHSIVDTTIEPLPSGSRGRGTDLAINLRNLVPAPHLRARFAAPRPAAVLGHADPSRSTATCSVCRDLGLARRRLAVSPTS